MGKTSLSAGALLSLLIMPACNGMNTAGGLHTIDHMVPHVSTVPANKGEQVQIFVREKVSSSESPEPRPVVLMVHDSEPRASREAALVPLRQVPRPDRPRHAGSHLGAEQAA